MTTILVPILIGERIGKRAIFDIKHDQFADPDELSNVQRKLAEFSPVRQQVGVDQRLVQAEWDEARAVNVGLWSMEDGKYAKQASASFDADLITLARPGYFENEKRDPVKQRIHLVLASTIVKEKSDSNLAGAQTATQNP
jgi:hypothetical protein